MSSELERLLREAREALPGPDDDATERARTSALAAIRLHRPRARVIALVGAALVGAVALGVGLGSLVAPSSTAAREPAGVGFLPEPGWSALQSPPPAVLGQPAVAVATNVPLARDDVVHGLADPSGLPYSTLVALPNRGAVIVASITPRVDQPWLDDFSPETTLPLRLVDALPHIQYGAQVRPEEPLGQYQLRARVREYNVDVQFYFGTPRPSPALWSQTQRQLEQLVLHSSRETPRGAIAAGTSRSDRRSDDLTVLRVIDRTVRCSIPPRAGIRKLSVHSQAGVREQTDRSKWFALPYAALFGDAGGVSILVQAGGTPPKTSLYSETLSIGTELCVPVATRIALARGELRSGPASQLLERYECTVPRRVVVRIKAEFRTSPSLRVRRSVQWTAAPLKAGYVAVHTESGTPLVYSEVFESGKARLFTARRCTPE